MPRAPRVAVGGMVYHVLNRANARMELFSQAGDYELFEAVLAEAHERAAMRTMAYCVMPNHWHLVVWPRRDGDLSAFMRWLTLTHTQRRHAAAGTPGGGHLYQGRFKSFPVQSDQHFLTVCRYVERNALRAGLVQRAQQWQWGSLWARRHPGARADKPPLSVWPVDTPTDWLELVNQPLTAAELAAVRACLSRGRPFGGESWVHRTARRLGLLSTFRPRGRPRKDGRRPTRASRKSG